MRTGSLVLSTIPLEAAMMSAWTSSRWSISLSSIVPSMVTRPLVVDGWSGFSASSTMSMPRSLNRM
jgi:hypothetical protein